jgi:hypothetical protein
MDLAALKAEIETGPLASELAPFVAAKAYEEAAGVLNRQDRPTKVNSVDAVALRRLILKLWGGFSTDTKELLMFLAATGLSFDGTNAEDVALLTTLIGVDVPTLTDKFISRIEEVDSIGSRIVGGDVFWATEVGNK